MVSPVSPTAAATAPYPYETITKASKLRSDDIVIALMGPTGSGKSTIIDTLCGSKRAGSNLASCTADVEAIRIRNHPVYDNRLILLDTPGFDDTNKSDLEILQLISDWLVQMYKEETKLTAILYLHRITDNRMSGTPNRNLHMFGKLTGDKAARNVVFVTTTWDRLAKHEVGEKRERELKDSFWNVMLHHGAAAARFNNTKDAAWNIIDDAVARNTEGVTLLVQEELVDLRLRLRETAAGQALYIKLEYLVSQQKDTVAKLFEQIQMQSDPAKKKALLEEYLKIHTDLEKTMEETSQLHVTFFRKLGRRFFGRKAKAHAVNMG